MFEETVNYAEYQYYLNLKGNLRFEYKGIDLMDALAADVIDVVVAHIKKNCRAVAYTMTKRLRTKPLYEALDTHSTMATIDAKNRKDHAQLSQLIAGSIADCAKVDLQSLLYYRPTGLFRALKYLRFVRRHIAADFVSQLYLAARMAQFSILIDDLDGTFGDKTLAGKNYLPFCASAYNEALLTLYFKRRGAATFYMMHGNLGYYTQKITNDICNICNQITDYMLVFGEQQKRLFVGDFGIAESKVLVAGNPKYPEKKIQFKNTYRNCIVLGGIEFYDEYLAKLLPIIDSLAERMGISFTLKPHPLSKITEYPEFRQSKYVKLVPKQVTLQELFEKGNYDFAITNNTAAYYECMYYSVRPLRWGCGENMRYEMPGDDKFFNGDELEEIIRGATSSDTEQLSRKAGNVLACVFGMGINRYDEYVNKHQFDEKNSGL